MVKKGIQENIQKPRRPINFQNNNRKGSKSIYSYVTGNSVIISDIFYKVSEDGYEDEL